MTQTPGAASPRGWYHGWNVVAVCILSQVAANGLTFNGFSLFLKGWTTDLHAPIHTLQYCVLGMILVAAPLSPFIGVIADKYPARRLFAAGLIGVALFYLVVSFVTETWQLLACYALLIPVPLTLSTAIPANALISRWFVRRVGLALGLSAFGIGMAGVVLPPIISDLLPTIGWRMIWRFGGLLVALIIMPLVVLVIRDRPSAERDGLSYLTGDGGGRPQAHGHAAGGNLGWLDVIRRKNFLLLLAVYLPILALNGSVQQNLAPYAELHGLSLQQAGVLISTLSFAHLVATFSLGWVSDRFGNRLPFAGLAVIMALGAAVLSFGAGFWVIAFGCVLIGFGGGFYTLLGAAIATEFGATGFGRAYGLAMLFLPVVSLSPVILASARENTGSYTPALLGFAALIIVGGILVLFMRERRDDPLTGDEKETVLEEAVSPIA